MSIVTVHNLESEFDGNETRLEHSDESDIPLYRRKNFQNSSCKNTLSLTCFIQSIVEHVLRCENVIEKEVAIAMVSKDYIRQYNARFRNKDFATDVLSFPDAAVLSYKGPENQCEMQSAFSMECSSHAFEHADNFHAFAKLASPCSDEISTYLGDVLVCCDYVSDQAQEHGEVFERELARVIIHGVLHLLGYTHTSYDMKRNFMLKKQERILTSFVFPNIEYSSQH